ncbi:hypothetical protein DRH29_05510 [candidate division Kazan bacterium]|uniref:Uncharacterized protein n=1 Tax=candidate division Kazan bacterium TaxID=2202143 RepID=A0A420ZB40_UNCK3|nr:MAG: hypothetical protein DRH29_05510 [candidate division Kazan bacterium]
MKRIRRYCRSKRRDTVRYVFEVYFIAEYFWLEAFKSIHEERKVKRNRLCSSTEKIRETANKRVKAIVKIMPSVADGEYRDVLETYLKAMELARHFADYAELAVGRSLTNSGKLVKAVRQRIKRFEKLLDYTRFDHCWCVKIPEVLDDRGRILNRERFDNLVKLLKLYLSGAVGLDDFELLFFQMLNTGFLGRFELIDPMTALRLDEDILKEFYIRNIIREFEKMYGKLGEREKEKLRKIFSSYPAISLEALWYSVEYFRLSGSEFVRRFLASEFLGKL